MAVTFGGVMFADTIVVVFAATAIRPHAIELIGIAGATGDGAGTPATIPATAVFVPPE